MFLKLQCYESVGHDKTSRKPIGIEFETKTQKAQIFS